VTIPAAARASPSYSNRLTGKLKVVRPSTSDDQAVPLTLVADVLGIDANDTDGARVERLTTRPVKGGGPNR